MVDLIGAKFVQVNFVFKGDEGGGAKDFVSRPCLRVPGQDFPDRDTAGRPEQERAFLRTALVWRTGWGTQWNLRASGGFGMAVAFIARKRVPPEYNLLKEN